MGLLGSLNCFSSSKKKTKKRKKQQQRQRSNGNGSEGQQLLSSPLSFTSSSTAKSSTNSSSRGSSTIIISTPKINLSSKKQYSTALSTNLVSSPHDTPSLLREDDNSIPTIDSTYNKYNSQYSLSDAGGTIGSHQQASIGTSTFGGSGGGASSNANNYWPMSPLSPFGAITSPGLLSPFGQVTSPGEEQLVVVPPKQKKKEEEYTIIYAPSGVLGVVIDTPSSSSSSNTHNNANNSHSGRMTSSSSRPVVHAIKDTCPIRNQIHVGDILIAVDDIDVTHMTAVEVSQLISKKSMQTKRKLTLIRSGSSIGGSRLYDGRRR